MLWGWLGDVQTGLGSILEKVVCSLLAGEIHGLFDHLVGVQPEIPFHVGYPIALYFEIILEVVC